MRFTEEGVKQLRPKKSRFMLTEGAGLYLQVLPGGTKKWVHFHRSGSKQKWIALGYYPDTDVANARKKNEAAAKYATNGTNNDALSLNSTLHDLFDKWHGNAKDKKGKPWSPAYKRNVKYMFEADVLPILGDKKLRDIRKSDIRALLQKKEMSLPGQALEIYRRLSRIFNYAASQDYIEASPMSSLGSIGSSNAKDRYLSAEEIKVFLQSLPFADMTPNTAHALELILRTGQRPSEICRANISEFRETLWVIPGSRTKNGLEQRVPLTKKIKELFGTANEHGLFFPSLKDPTKPIDALTLSRALRRSLTGAEKKKDTAITIPIAPTFSPHDLRRTCATGLVELGFSIEVIAAVLNYKPRTVTGIHYKMHKYDTEMRKAIETWESKLGSILKEQKVIATNPEPRSRDERLIDFLENLPKTSDTRAGSTKNVRDWRRR
jgi:integrase